MRKLFLSTVAAAAVLSSGAFAADLPVRGPAVAPAPIFVGMNWTGFYIGAQIGYSWGESTHDFRDLAGVIFPFSSNRNTSPDGFFGGLHAGYNHQIGSLVLGIEGDIEATGARGSFTFANGDRYRTSSDWQGSLRARVGVAFNRALLYVTGGVAFAEVNDSVLNFGANTTVRSSHTAAGWTIGGGLEYAITNNWTARAEYRYRDLGNHRYNTAPAFDGSLQYDYKDHSVRVGLSYLFGGPAGPVVAKY